MKKSVTGTDNVVLSIAGLLAQHNKVTAVEIVQERAGCQQKQFTDTHVSEW